LEYELKKADKEKNISFIKSDWKQGVKVAIPIAIGYIPIAITFGILAKSSGMPNTIAMLMSLLIFAGASQFIATNLIALGSTIGEIILTVFIINLRHFLLTASLSQRLEKNVSNLWRALISFGVTDETFTIASLQPEKKLSKEFLLSLNTTAFLAWNLGTWIGIFLAIGIPKTLQSSMGIALYAMFIALLLPSMRQSLSITVVAFTAMIIHYCFQWIPFFDHLSTGWYIVFSTITSALLGAIIFPNKEESQ
jgi:4-azaleucine resistance transporter AzlC